MSEIDMLLKRSEEKLSTAKLLLDEERYEDSVSRAYYSMYHAAKAVLLLEDSSPRTHAGVASELGRLFRDRIDSKLISKFSTIQQLREDADYGLEAEIGAQRANEAKDAAERFLSEAKKLVGEEI